MGICLDSQMTISDIDRLEIGRAIGECRTFADRQKTRIELVKLFNCSKQKISAIGIQYCIANGLPNDEDVDEWWQKRAEYSNDAKCEYRLNIKNFLSKSLIGRDFSKLKLVCLPGVHCWEIQDYLDLGFKAENIWGVERVLRDFELMQYRANQFGINIVHSILNNFLKSCDTVFDVVVMDYKGQLCDSYLDDIDAVKMSENGVLITNFWCRRERNKIQDGLDLIYRRTKARIMASIWLEDKERFPDKSFIDISSLINELSVPTLEQSRAAIAGLIAEKLNYKFNPLYDDYKDAHRKYELWSTKFKRNDLFDYFAYVLEKYSGITDKSRICSTIDSALFAAIMSHFNINSRSHFESFDYQSTSRFYTTMIAMHGVTNRYYLEPSILGRQLIQVMDNNGSFVVDDFGDLVYSGVDGRYTWTHDSFFNTVEFCVSCDMSNRERLSDFNNMWSIEISDEDLESNYNSVGLGRFREIQNSQIKKKRKMRNKLLSVKLSSK